MLLFDRYHGCGRTRPLSQVARRCKLSELLGRALLATRNRPRSTIDHPSCRRRRECVTKCESNAKVPKAREWAASKTDGSEKMVAGKV